MKMKLMFFFFFALSVGACLSLPHRVAVDESVVWVQVSGEDTNPGSPSEVEYHLMVEKQGAPRRAIELTRAEYEEYRALIEKKNSLALREKLRALD